MMRILFNKSPRKRRELVARTHLGGREEDLFGDGVGKADALGGRGAPAELVNDEERVLKMWEGRQNGGHGRHLRCKGREPGLNLVVIVEPSKESVVDLD